jgi:hypothetical protein
MDSGFGKTIYLNLHTQSSSLKLSISSGYGLGCTKHLLDTRLYRVDDTTEPHWIWQECVIDDFLSLED